MTISTLEELDRSIEQEQMRVTAEAFAEAWDDVSAEGIAPTVIAEAAVHALFARVLEKAGETGAEALLREVAEAIRCGHYLPETAIQ